MAGIDILSGGRNKRYITVILSDHNSKKEVFATTAKKNNLQQKKKFAQITSVYEEGQDFLIVCIDEKKMGIFA